MQPLLQLLHLTAPLQLRSGRTPSPVCALPPNCLQVGLATVTVAGLWPTTRLLSLPIPYTALQLLFGLLVGFCNVAGGAVAYISGRHSCRAAHDQLVHNLVHNTALPIKQQAGGAVCMLRHAAKAVPACVLATHAAMRPPSPPSMQMASVHGRPSTHPSFLRSSSLRL